MSKEANKFPVEEILPELKNILSSSSIVILTAPPGAGKTTLVPPALTGEEWLGDKKIIMLEPRRLAARRAAEYMSGLKNEKCGQTIGYRIRNENCISASTRIEVVTEGILTRMLQSDAELPEAGLVIFDEFHERSIHADTGLAFLLDVQKNIRPDIKILIMSATPDIEGLQRLLGEVPVVRSAGRAFPVEVHYQKHPASARIEERVTDAVISALKKEDGDILVFLPGKGEIKRTSDLLSVRLHDSNITVHELYGEAPRQQQDQALSRTAGLRRKVILSTSIAETSLTIDGIKIVIDSGLSRLSAFDIRRGMAGLITVPVSKASAEQRCGRAGRQQPGVCFRLWTKEEEALHPEFTPPEILSTDLTPLALELANWGAPDAGGLMFPDRPSEAALARARSVLMMLEAVDENGRLTQFGKKISQLPVHPRLSAMILKARDHGFGYEACLLAAMLEERDTGGRSSIDLSERMEQLGAFTGGRSSGTSMDSPVIRIKDQAERLRKMAGIRNGIAEAEHTGLLLAIAYPERIARKVSGIQYQLVQGTMVTLPEGNPLLRNEFIAIGEVDGAGAVAKVFSAAPLGKDDILGYFGNIMKEESTAEWNESGLRGIKKLKLGNISVSEKEYVPSDQEAEECILEIFKKGGLARLPWDRESRSLIERSEWYRTNVLTRGNNASDWPILTDEALASGIDKWLRPFLPGVRRKKDIENLDMTDIIKSVFTFEQLKELDAQAPVGLKVPGGSFIRLNYAEGEKPVLAVKLQELFGQTDTPDIAGGRIPVLIHLLSPAMRPLAITQDLRSFWTNTYPAILKQMKMKYPKHVWPEDPLNALPTNRTKRRI
ncbi:MAG: ATP-dependent helicase HrpB [Syntrophothermus sp.]